MKKLVIAAAFVAALLVGCAERQARLETGGAYAQEGYVPDMTFYQMDSAFKFANGTLDSAFKIEEDNRALLWSIDPNIKRSLDAIRDDAWMFKTNYLAAREVYKSTPVPANLEPLQLYLSKLQQLEATAKLVVSNIEGTP